LVTLVLEPSAPPVCETTFQTTSKREIQRDRETHKQRNRKRERERGGERERESYRHRHRQRQRERDRDHANVSLLLRDLFYAVLLYAESAHRRDHFLHLEAF